METGTLELEVPAGERTAPEFQGHFSLACLSALLEHGGEAASSDVAGMLAERGARKEQVQDSFRGTLRRTGKVIVEQGQVMVTAKGLEYVAENVEYIEEADSRIVEGEPKFAPVKYQILSYIQTASGRGRYVLPPENRDRAIPVLAARLDLTPANLGRNLRGYESDGLVEAWKHDDGTIVNFGLSRKGVAELADMRERFGPQIAELENRWTMEAMQAEINNMRCELGEDPQDFEAVQKNKVPQEIKRLQSVMGELMRRLDGKTQVQ